MAILVSNDNELHFIALSNTHHKISVNYVLTIDSNSNVTAFLDKQPITLSLTATNDARQIVIRSESKVLQSSNSVQFQVTKVCNNIQNAIFMLEEVISGSVEKVYTSDDTSMLARLQFILCQLENATVPKNRRGYNIITQVLSLKGLLIASSCYKY